MEFTPSTDREIYQSLNNEIKNLREAIERFGGQLFNLETNKFTNHELRIEALERIEQERKGMWKLILAVGVFLSIAVSVIAVKLFFK